MTENRSDKHAAFDRPARRRAPLLAIAALLVVALAAAAWLWLPGGGHFTTVRAENGVIALPEAAFADGQARFYRYLDDRGPIEFFMVKSRDGVIRAAFDTCDVCYQARKGYRQEGDFMVCNNCNQQFRSDMINEIKGGCNPAPLSREVRNGQLLVRLADLESGRPYFAVN